MRIEGLERNQVAWSLRPLYWYLGRMFGKVLTPIKVLAHRPGVTLAMTAMNAAMEYSHAAPDDVKSLVSLRAAQLVGCPF